MRTIFRVCAAGSILLTMNGCNRFEDHEVQEGAKSTFSLCAKGDNARVVLLDQLRLLAEQQQARTFDRSQDARKEIASDGPDVLRNTGGGLILITVEKDRAFRITLGNLGLREKLALTIRTWGDIEAGDVTARFVNGLGDHWEVDRTDGSVTNDPPC